MDVEGRIHAKGEPMKLVYVGLDVDEAWQEEVVDTNAQLVKAGRDRGDERQSSS